MIEQDSGSDAHELEALYRSLATPLERIVRRDVRAPEEVIEDACQSAWRSLIGHWGRVRREAALTWLAAAAVHEAYKLVRRDRRELSLEELLDDGGDAGLGTGASGLEELLQRRARLEAIAALPRRQQRVVWLQGAGFSYLEMAERTGDSRRTIERQLLRAKRSLRELER